MNDDRAAPTYISVCLSHLFMLKPGRVKCSHEPQHPLQDVSDDVGRHAQLCFVTQTTKKHVLKHSKSIRQTIVCSYVRSAVREKLNMGGKKLKLKIKYTFMNSKLKLIKK